MTGPLRERDRLIAWLAEQDATCPACGYALRGIRDPRCPECGRTLTLAALRRSPRRDARRLFALGSLGLLTAFVTLLALVSTMARWGPQSRVDLAGDLRLVIFIAWLCGFVACVAFWLNAAASLARGPRTPHLRWALVCWAVAAGGSILALVYVVW
ncbi:MAG: hypothetical protein ACYTJ0_07160 [Planctomycetota bacterium]|jgi:hypothetical protein